ncbi:MAG: hypothetical protein U0Y82_04675 [Thermoleophilia bacterium]
MSLPDDIHRIAVKVPLATPERVQDDALIRVFHAWIREGGVLDGLLIDVADYRHVPEGPGVMLIGHEWDRQVDHGGGRAGVRSTAKRGLSGTLPERIRAVAADAFRAADALADPRWLGDAAARGDGEVEVCLLDRLAAPNTPEAFDDAAAAVAEALSAFGAVGAPGPGGDPRGPLTVRVAVTAA